MIQMFVVLLINAFATLLNGFTKVDSRRIRLDQVPIVDTKLFLPKPVRVTGLKNT